MIRLISTTSCGALLGALLVFLLADGLPEGAIVGVILGGSLGLLVAVRKDAGGKAAAYEYEAAGIHDDNLITTARRNLVREVYRDSATPRHILDEKIERRAGRSKRE